MKNTLNNPEYLNEFPNHTEIKLHPFYHTNLKNTLETIVFKEKSTKEKRVLGKVFSDKSKTSKATVKALLNEIDLRENLDSHLLDRIIKKGLIRFDKPLSNIQFYGGRYWN